MKNIQYLNFAEANNIRALITTRKHPNLCPYINKVDKQATTNNRGAFVKQHGLLYLATCKQIHGDRLIEAGPDIGEQQADAIWTDKKNVAIGVFTADCIPVLITAEKGKIIMAIHAGRKGIASQIVVKALSGLNPQTTTIWLGPSICKNSYEIDRQAADQCLDNGFNRSNLEASPSGGILCDLRSELVEQLKNSGFYHISHLHQCTKHNKNGTWYSHRNGDSGRMLSCLWICQESSGNTTTISPEFRGR